MASTFKIHINYACVKGKAKLVLSDNSDKSRQKVIFKK